MEIRPLVNGYPGDLSPTNPNLVSYMPSSSIVLSEDASAGTFFKFDPPIYLAEDNDYCFVLLSNSNQYNVFTSQMGELSIENEKMISEQPFIGSLFKSENNITWTAYQFEDIKFKMYKAKFDISEPAILDLESMLSNVSASGNQFFTNIGTSRIYHVAMRQHGLQIGDKVSIGAHPSLMYNGIPGTLLTGEFDVVDIRSESVFGFDAKPGAIADRDGGINFTNGIVKVHVQNSGINYTADNTTISFSSGSATATPIIENGKIVGVTVTNMGTGYTVDPQVIVTSATGSGASLIAVRDAVFNISLNKNMTSFSPHIKFFNYDNTYTRNFVNTTIGNYAGGNLVSYTSNPEIEFSEKSSVNMPVHSLIASRSNESWRMSNDTSFNVRLEMHSTNPNLSPVFDSRSIPQVFAYETVINNQPGEDRTSVNPTASIDSISLTSAGAGYTIVPTVEFLGGGGTGAAATVTISGGVINGFTLTNAGSGYTRTPLVRVIPAAIDTTGSGGAIRAFLTPYNSELLASHGNALSRYVTRRIGLSVVSTGIRLYAAISSGQHTNVDWYVRTSYSSSGVDHETLNWTRLDCAVERNISSTAGEFYQYTFELNDMQEFDTYDLKCVMLSDNPIYTPYISGYRVIVVA